MRYTVLAGALALFCVGATAYGAAAVTDVTVKGSRVHLGDVVAGLASEVADLDLGPAPSFRGTRVIGRDEIVRALHEQGIDGVRSVPEAVRVHRRLRTLNAAEVSRIVTSLLQERLPKGTTLGEVRPLPSVVLPDGWTDIYCDLPRPPHRTGPLASAVTLSFFEGDRALWSLSVAVDLLLSKEATVYDVPRGSRVTFMIRRGLVEVSSTGTVTTDADIGSVAPVVVMPSGRSLLARLEDAHTAVMVDTP